MNRNQLKILACITMFIDHMGLLLFPGVQIFRIIGRIAMPIFAFFIGEGCRYTSNKKKYFLSVFLLGLGCQLVYILDALIETGNLGYTSDAWYLNILLTFSVAILGCYLLPEIKNRGVKTAGTPYVLFAVCYILLLTAGAAIFPMLRSRGWSLAFDYGIWGMLLPISVVVFDKKYLKLGLFSAVLLLYCLFTFREMPIVWFSLLSLLPLLLYNGKSGSKKLKYGFYVFYPAHLGLLYLVAILLHS